MYITIPVLDSTPCGWNLQEYMGTFHLLVCVCVLFCFFNYHSSVDLVVLWNQSLLGKCMTTENGQTLFYCTWQIMCYLQIEDCGNCGVEQVYGVLFLIGQVIKAFFFSQVIHCSIV